MATRNFAPISIEDLMVKMKTFNEGEDRHSRSNTFYELLEHLGTDIKVSFDLENVSDSPKDFGPKALMGFHTEANGLTYCGMCAGGDWEHPVFFCVYWDGKKLRGYIPTEGNPWNTTTKKAYGNDDDKDAKNAHKRWPNKFPANYADQDEPYPEISDFEFDPELIRQDILNRLVPPEQKSKKPKNVVAPVKQPDGGLPPLRPRKGPKTKIQDRIKLLTYHGGGEGYELFHKTCQLSLSLFNIGMKDKAEIACAWAEEMANGTLPQYLQNPNKP